MSKRIFCIVLAVLMTVVPLLYDFADISFAVSDSLTAGEFVTEVSEMVKKGENNYGEENEKEYNTESTEFKTCRLIVKSSNKIDTYGANKVISGYDNLWILEYDSASKTQEAYERYINSTDIEYAEPDREVYALDTESSSITEETEKSYLSWGPEYIGIDVMNNDIISEGVEVKDTVVAVLDTGVDASHPFFEGRVIPTDVNTSTSGNRNDSTDDNGHGTQVAGVIIDSTLDNVTVKPYKVLDSYGNGTLLTLAAGIISAVYDGVDVINLSVAFDESSEILRNAVLLADSNDIILVGASGNDSSDTLYYPSSYESVFKIAAINESSNIANYSTRGNDIDFAAPGSGIYTTTLNSKYKTVSGTSFAAPFVSALVATMLSFDPKLSGEDINNILIDNVRTVSDSDFEYKYGNGIITAPGLWDVSDSSEKTATPYFSIEPAIFTNHIDLEIFCDTPNSVIYYTTDRTVPSKSNTSSLIYDGNPIHISQTAVINAVAYCDGLYRSAVSSFGSIIAPILSDENFTVDESGTLISYNGTARSFTVPETVNGITVTSVGSGVFSSMDITEVIFHDSVTSIGANAFEECTSLKTVIGKGVTSVSDNAFYNCIMLRNTFFGQLTSIGKYSFYNVCSQQFALSGITFNLSLENVSTIAEGAFKGSSISNLKLGSPSSIGKNAFELCNALVSVSMECLTNIGNDAFLNCTSLVSVDIPNLTFLSSRAFMGCTALVSVTLPDVSYVNPRAFEGCTALRQITLEAAETVYSSAFTKCNSLRIINLPVFTGFESAVYSSNSTTYPKFTSALEAFIAPSIQKTSPYMFSSASNLKIVSFKNLTAVADYTFSGCNSLQYVNIQNVSDLSEFALSGSTIRFIDARSLVTAAALPDNSGIMLSSGFTEIAATATALTVYASSGTVAEQFAVDNDYEFRPLPYFYDELPRCITEESGSVTVSAVGFDLQYQWYKNSINSNSGGTPIEGATSETYVFTESDTEYYYYCVVTQNDCGIISQSTTSVIIKDPLSADYRRYNSEVRAARKLNPNNYTNFEVVEKELSVDVSGRRSCEQSIVDAQTTAIRVAVAKLKYKNVTGIRLTASDYSVPLSKRIKINVIKYPVDGVYANIEWSSENKDAFVVSQNGYARCVGDGSAYIVAKVTNHDGSVVMGRVKLSSGKSTWLDRILLPLVKIIFVIAAEFPLIKN